jgi:hypothetical protein
MLTYELAKSELARARVRAKGRPYKTHMRIFDHPSKDGVIQVRKKYGNEVIADLYSNGNIQLWGDPCGYTHNYATHFGVMMHRFAVGEYACRLTEPDAHLWRSRFWWTEDGKLAPEWRDAPRFKPGMIVNHGIVTGRVIERADPAPTKIRDADKAKAWTKQVKEYGKGWRIAARVGAITGHLKSVFDELNALDRSARQAYWDSYAVSSTRAVEIIENRDYSREAVLGLICHNQSIWWASNDLGRFVRVVLGYGTQLEDAASIGNKFTHVWSHHSRGASKEKGIYQ